MTPQLTSDCNESVKASFAASTCSAAACERLEAANEGLMKAAIEFSHQWGRDQTVHPKMYWLELHMDTWRKLARAAVAYSDCVEPPNDKVS